MLLGVCKNMTKRVAATIGFFDGVHRGHQFLLDSLKQVAAENDLDTMVITFTRHPRQVIDPQWIPQLITSSEEKKRLLLEAGIDHVMMLDFDMQLASLSAREFMLRMKEEMGVELLLTGYDNRFGHDRRETFNDYVRYGKEIGIDVRCATPFSLDSTRISSSLVRRFISEGDVRRVTECLGRYYSINGIVVHGYQIGRQLGYPTANIYPDETFRIIPSPGVYAVRFCINDGKPLLYVDERSEMEAGFPAMLNIGTRPTFDGHQQTIEAHLFDFNGNLYDRSVTVFFIERLRSEQNFDSPEQLMLQMAEDEQKARSILNSHSTQ